MSLLKCLAIHLRTLPIVSYPECNSLYDDFTNNYAIIICWWIHIWIKVFFWVARSFDTVGKDCSRDRIFVQDSTHLGPGRHVITNSRLQCNLGKGESFQQICGENGKEYEVPSNSGWLLFMIQLSKGKE